VVIVGAGGHGQVVGEILLRMQEADPEVVPIGYVDDDSLLVGRSMLGLPVLGGVGNLARVPHDAFVVAIGDNRTRQRVYERLCAQAERPFTARHPSATVAADAEIGPGCTICAGVVVCTGSVVGANVLLNTSCTVDHHCRVGDHVHVTPGAHLGGEVRVGEGAFLGMGSVVIPCCTVGAWAVVGAGACVIRPVAAGQTVVGVPAKPLRTKRVVGSRPQAGA